MAKRSTIAHDPVDPFSSLDQLRALLDTGVAYSQELCQNAFERMDIFEPVYNAVIERNPDAMAIAAAADHGRSSLDSSGPLEGIPILVKDNLDSADAMQTSAGSLALANPPARIDSEVVARLRAAGAILLGKTNLSEWANIRSTRSSSGWSSRGGQTRNAFDSMRTPGGSSSGSGAAVALGYCAAAIGTETSGSIIGPSSMNALVGIKPSIGLVSRAGIIPISSSQDTAGPMARSVRDAALVLDAIVGVDERDPVTGRTAKDYVAIAPRLERTSLKGARLGIATNYLGLHYKVDRLFARAVEALRDAGADVIDCDGLSGVMF